MRAYAGDQFLEKGGYLSLTVHGQVHGHVEHREPAVYRADTKSTGSEAHGSFGRRIRECIGTST